MATAKEKIIELQLAIQEFQSRLRVFERHFKNKEPVAKLKESKEKLLVAGRAIGRMCAKELTDFEQQCLDQAAEYMSQLLKENEK